MSDETLKPCPFCGGEASVKVLEYDDDCKVWGVFCESDLECEYGHGHFVDNYPTEAEAISAWNTRSDYAVQAENERKAEQAIAATLGDDGYRQAAEYWKGMYEELLTERIGEERDYPEHDGRYECPDCGNVVYYDELYGGGWTIYVEDYQIPFNNCPKCGKAVER